ncbi:MAG: 1,4-dihydroxy-2-naphthoate polyprenyltransferase, partial [Chloroflexota bacterium]|nr:1,4-dihydroxy-2-naphthoate polyprenyltransferase [Chloroflexota bacterium]
MTRATRSAWLLAARPRTLPAAVAPIVVGSAVARAEGGFVLSAAVAALVVSLCLQVAANLANDLFDFQRGADTGARLGPPRATQSGAIAPRQMLLATLVVLLVAVVPGLYLVSRGGWLILLLGLLAMLAAVAYTGGRAPLGYLGLGEITVFIFFGFVGVAGTAYVQTGALTVLALFASVPVGCLVTAILVINNLRDLETDRDANKRTLAVRFGPQVTKMEYLLLVAVAYLLLPLGRGTGHFSAWWLLPFLSVPLAIVLGR